MRAYALQPTDNSHTATPIDPHTVQGRRLPPAVIDAQAAVIHPLNCLDLTAKAKQVLRALLGFYNVKKGGVIFPSRETLGAELGMPESTLRRWLAILQEKEYIQREPQRRRKSSRFAPGRQFSVTPILLTEKALVLAGLHQVIHKQPSLKVGDANKGEHGTKVEAKREQGGQNRERQCTEPTLPQDLVRLKELGLRPATICKLMGLARQHGKRLSDIIDAIADKLKTLQLPGRKLRNYLLRCIESATDFVKLAAVRAEEQRQAEQARADAEFVQQFQQAYRAKVLRSPDDREVIAINAAGTSALHRIGRREGTLVLERRVDIVYVLRKIELGQLVESPSPIMPPSTTLPPVIESEPTEKGRAALAGLYAVVKRRPAF